MTNRPPSEAPPWTILKLLRWTTSYFKSRHIENPRASAEILLSHMLGMERIDLYVRYDQPLMEHELADYKCMIQRRTRREPVAYIVGEKEFWSMALTVNAEVLIPRPETECLVETALSLLPPASSKKPSRILDAGTGSGAVALALHRERPGSRIFASDKSRKALRVARENAIRQGAGEKIAFFCGDWFAAIRPAASHFDLIISNPPYIRTEALAGLAPEIREYEPTGALDGGGDGLTAIRHLILRSPEYLADEGLLLMEIGYDQRRDIDAIARGCGDYSDIRFAQDYSGLDRVAVLQKKKNLVQTAFI